MDEICELIPSQKGNNKINVRGYLMTKDKCRGDKYYWCCDKQKSGCNGRATTELQNNLHCLVKFGRHNHAPQASDISVAKAVAEVKNKLEKPEKNLYKLFKTT